MAATVATSVPTILRTPGLPVWIQMRSPLTPIGEPTDKAELDPTTDTSKVQVEGGGKRTLLDWAIRVLVIRIADWSNLQARFFLGGMPIEIDFHYFMIQIQFPYRSTRHA